MRLLIRYIGAPAAALLLSVCLLPAVYAQEEPKPEPTIQELGKPDRPQAAEAGPNEMYIDFEDAPLQDVIKAISLFTGLNFEYDPATVNQRVTVVAHHPVPSNMALDILETILSARQLQLVKTLDGNMFRIIPKNPASADKLPLTINKEEPMQGFDRFAIHIVKVQYADVESVAQLLQGVSSGQGLITPYAPSGLLVLKDTVDGIRNMLRLLEVIDVPGTGTSVEIFPLQWTRAETLAQQVTEVLLGGDAGSAQGQPGAPAIVRRQPRVNEAGQQVADVIGQSEQVLRVVADERLNALIVVASEAMMEQVRFLVDQLDTANDPDTNNIRYRPLQNADGKLVAEALEEIISGSTPAGEAQGGQGGGGAPSGAVTAFERDVVISYYQQTNALLILASPQDFALLDDIITKLDVPARMVSVESMIMEVQVNDNASLGVESALLNQGDFFAMTNMVSLANLITSGGAGTAGAAAATGLLSLGGPGATIGILDGTTEIEIGGETVEIPNVPLLIRALETVTDVDVLSRPNMMIVDNREEAASINVGTEIPLISSLQDTNDQTGFQSRSRVERRSTGVILEIKPQIREGDYVNLAVKVEVSSPVRSPAGIDPNEQGASIAQSVLTTDVVLADGKTGIIGGLLRESLAHTVNQVPWLGDIPVIGWLFRSKGKARDKQNLVILLTPHVIRRGEDVDRITDARMEQFHSANVDAIFERGFIKRIEGKKEQRKTGPVMRGDGQSNLSGDFDRGRMRN